MLRRCKHCFKSNKRRINFVFTDINTLAWLILWKSPKKTTRSYSFIGSHFVSCCCCCCDKLLLTLWEVFFYCIRYHVWRRPKKSTNGTKSIFIFKAILDFQRRGFWTRWQWALKFHISRVCDFKTWKYIEQIHYFYHPPSKRNLLRIFVSQFYWNRREGPTTLNDLPSSSSSSSTQSKLQNNTSQTLLVCVLMTS